MAYTADDIVAWSTQFFPVLRFSKGPGGENEAFYPTDAEGWLQHKAAPSVVQGIGAPTRHFRGSAIYRWRAASASSGPEQWPSQLPVVAAGQIVMNATAPTGIGSAGFTTRPPEDPTVPASPPSEFGDWYVDFGGWCDEGSRRSGSLAYTWQQYKTRCYDPMNLPASVAFTEPDPCPTPDMSAPTQFAPDTSAMQAYAEVGPLKDILEQLLATPAFPPALSALDQGRTTIQGAASELADFIGVTYFMLYPANVPSNRKLMEGDWSAITAFLSEQAGGGMDLGFASYSRGYVDGVFPKPEAACKARADMEMSGAHPIAYVSWGTHANYFTARTDEAVVTAPPINTTAVTVVSVVTVIAAIGVDFILYGALSSPVGWVLIAIGVVLLIIVALIALIAWLAGAFDQPQSSASPPWDPFPPDESHPHSGDGETTGGTNAGTPGSPPPAPAPGTPPGFIVRPVSAMKGINDARTTPPAWWSYVGRWGVCVDDAAAMSASDSWRNGTWRRHPNGYTLAHRNVEALVDYLHGAIDAKTRTALTYNPLNR